MNGHQQRSAHHRPETVPEWQEILFAFGVFVVCGIALYVTRDTISFSQLTVLALLAVLLFAGLRYPAQSIIALTVWLGLESVGLKLIPPDSFVFVRFFPEVLLYALVAQRIYKGILRLQQPETQMPLTGSRAVHVKIRRLFVWALVVFIAIGFISIAFNAVDPVIGLLGIRQLVRFVLLGVLILFLEHTDIQKTQWWNWLVGIFAVELAIGLIQFFFNGRLDPYLLPSTAVEYAGGFVYQGVDQFWQLGTRIFATLGRYDRFGAFVGFFTVVVSAIPLSRLFGDFRHQYPLSSNRVQLYGWLFAVGMVAVFLSSSRAALFSMIAAMLWLMIIVFKKRWVFGVSVAGLVMTIVMAILYAQIIGLNIRTVVDSPDAGVFERLVEPLSVQSWRGNYDDFGRTFWMVEVPRTVVASSPIIGVGPGMFGSGTVAQFENREVYNRLGLPFGAGDDIGVIDNSWLSIWAEFGTLGVLAFASLLFFSYRYASTAIQHRIEYNYEQLLLIAGSQAAIIFMILLAFFGNHFEIRTSMALLWSVPLLLAQWRKPNA